MKTQLKKGEKVVMETRPHWFTLIGPFFIALIGSALSIVIALYYEPIGTNAMIGVAVFAVYFIYKMIQRQYNLWAVTNLRVIDEYGVFSNNTKESPLDKINNVSYQQSLGGKIFGYGNVQIQTAAEIGETNYVAVMHPQKLKDTITLMQEEYKQHLMKMQASEMASAMQAGQQSSKTDIAAELEKLYALKQKGILTEEEYNSQKAKILNS